MKHKVTEVIKNICCVKDIDVALRSAVTRWFKKFYSGCKNLDDQPWSGRSKTMDFEAVLEAINANLLSCIQRVSGKFSIS